MQLALLLFVVDAPVLKSIYSLICSLTSCKISLKYCFFVSYSPVALCDLMERGSYFVSLVNITTARCFLNIVNSSARA